MVVNVAGRQGALPRRPAAHLQALLDATLLAAALAIYAIDGVTTLAAHAALPDGREMNPVAAIALEHGVAGVVLLKTLVSVHVVASVLWLRRSGARWVALLVSGLLGLAGAWGVASAFLAGWRP